MGKKKKEKKAPPGHTTGFTEPWPEHIAGPMDALVDHAKDKVFELRNEVSVDGRKGQFRL